MRRCTYAKELSRLIPLAMMMAGLFSSCLMLSPIGALEEQGIAIVPGNQALMIGNSFTFSAAGGEPPYTFQVSSGSGTIDSSTGMYTAPGTPGTEMIRVTDSSGKTNTAVVAVVGPVTVTPSTLSLITGESLLIGASGGFPGYSFSDAGSGYIHSSSGLYSAPLGLAPTSEIVRATDSQGNFGTRTVQIRAFETSEDLPSVQSATASSTPWGIAVDSGGNIYAVGYHNSYSGTWCLVRKSADSGATWSVVDRYSPVLGGTCYGKAVTVDPSGNVFAAYQSSGRWIIRKSADGGATWTIVDDFDSGSNGGISGLATTSTGVIYLSGWATDSTGYRWLVRKGTAGGGSWSTVDDFILRSGSPAFANGIAVDQTSGQIYVTGQAMDLGDEWWVTRTSIDGGVTWSTSDQFILVGIWFTYGVAVAVDPTTQDVYVAGYAQDGNWPPKNRWVVRKSADSGGTWSTVDNFTLASGQNNQVYGATVSSSGTIYITGESYDSGGVLNLITRTSTDSGATWTTSDQFIGASSVISEGRAVAADGSGNVYVAATTRDSASPYTDHWVIRSSADSGDTWATAETYNFVGTRSNKAIAVFQAPSGDLFATGQVPDASGIIHWVVRKSTDSGATWSASDDFRRSGTYAAYPSAIAADGSGNLYVVGLGYTASKYQWVVRKSANGGATWSTVDDYVLTAGKYAAATSIRVTSDGTLYVAGYGQDGSDIYNWIVRKSTDSGTTWSTIDTYVFAAGKATYAYALSSDSNDALYAAGYSIPSGGTYDWIVRKSTDGGSTWSLVDDFKFDPTGTSLPSAIAIDASDRVYVAGRATDSAGYHWIVRKSANGGSSWTTVDDVVASGLDSSAAAITVDPSGALFAGGYTADPTTGMSAWVVRKSADAGVTWKTVDSFNHASGYNGAVTGIAPCLTNRICVAGSSVVNPGDGSSWTVRILSP